MGLGILLDEPKAVFVAGDVVKGRVVLQSNKDEAVGAVLISFTGRAKTKLRRRNGNNRSDIYRGRGNFFRYSKELYQGHYTLRANTYQWPFEFSFPSQTDPTVPSDVFDSSPPFQSNSTVHPLPPTFSHSTSGFGRRFESYVEYKLDATITRPASSYKFLPSNLENELALKYLPCRAVQQPNLGLRSTQRLFTARSLRLIPSKADAKLSMKERMKSTFSKSDLPSASFSLTVEFPTQIYPGGPFPLRLSMQHTSSTCPGKPDIFLRSVNVEVKTKVLVCAPAFYSDRTDHDSWRHQILNCLDLHVKVPDSQRAAQPDSVRDAALWLDLSSLGNPSTRSIQTDFNTYNIAIFNRLDIELKVSCADQSFTFSHESGLLVLSPAFAGRAPVAAREPIAAVVHSDTLAPPAYEHAPEYQQLPEQSSSGDSAQKAGPV